MRGASDAGEWEAREERGAMSLHSLRESNAQTPGEMQHEVDVAYVKLVVNPDRADAEALVWTLERGREQGIKPAVDAVARLAGECV